MAFYKKYKSVTGVEYSFYVTVDGKEKIVSFNGPGATLFVRDKKLAKAIEESTHFKKKRIRLVNVIGADKGEDKEESVQEETVIGDEYPNVKNMGDAVEVLITKYGVDEADIARKAQVLAKAKELGVIFPNYK